MTEHEVGGQELEVMRAPPRAGRGHGRTGRPPSWTKARALAALSRQRRRPAGMPDVATLHKLFGSWNAAMEAAGWEPRKPGYGR